MKKPTTVTLSDVAKEAGVSSATVSRCLNSPNLVKDLVKDKVEEAIRKLGYVPHGAARALASNKSRMVGAVFPLLDNSLFGDVMEVLQKTLSEQNYTLVVASSNYNPDLEYRHIRNLITCGVDALLLVGAGCDDHVYEMIQGKGVPYVNTWISQAKNGGPCVGFDNQAAAYKVTDYLLTLGHRDIGMISGISEYNDRARARIEGVKAALGNQGIELSSDRIVEDRFGIQEGRSAFRKLMTTKTPPTAIVCGSDPFAYGAIFEASKMGISIPGDVSITGFDDMEFSAYVTPALTTLHTPREEMARMAGHYLMQRIRGEEPVVPAALPVELIVRESTAPTKS